MPSDTEGIAALFSMYNDDDDEEEESDEPKPPSPAPPAAAAAPEPHGVPRPPSSRALGDGPNPSQVPPSPPLTDEPASRQTLASPHPSPALPPSRRSSSPFAASSPSPLRPPSIAPPADLPRPPRRGALAIVDYAHDEMAMSPEQEDGEIMSGADKSGSDIQAAEGNQEEQILPEAVSQNSQAEISQQSDAPEQNQIGTYTAMEVSRAETEDAQMEETPDISNSDKNDPLSRFLPPPVTKKCSAALQQKFNKFLAYQRAGKSFNAEVRNRKDYRNPDFLQHAVRYHEIDQIGSCFSKDVFDPHGYDKSDYYDEIEADMKRELERKEQEKKRNPKVEFIAGGLQAPSGASIPKIPALPGMAAVPVPTEGLQKETRANKKSKWDKVDGDIKNPAVPREHDNPSTTVSASLLTSANVGAGYAAFAHQKRREAEDKRASDLKSDKRS